MDLRNSSCHRDLNVINVTNNTKIIGDDEKHFLSNYIVILCNQFRFISNHRCYCCFFGTGLLLIVVALSLTLHISFSGRQAGDLQEVES